jgi:hypothetical protein
MKGDRPMATYDRPTLGPDVKIEPFQPKTGAVRVNLETFLLETTTDSRGFFSAPHGLPHTGATALYEIEGITVAVQHQNKNWHTLEMSEAVDNRFWWNDTVVQGFIASPNFYNRPVRIIVFAQPFPG